MKTKVITTIMITLFLASMLNVALVKAPVIPTVEWLPPLTKHEEFAFTDGSTLPIKFRLLDATGSFVMDSTVEVSVNDILFSDDFEDGGAAGWTEVGSGGTWTVEYDADFASLVYSQEDTSWTTTTTYDTYWRSYGDTGWTDYTVEAKVKIVSGGFAPIAGIFFRVQGTDLTSGYYMFRIDARSGTGPALIKSPNKILAGGHPGYPQFEVNPAVIGQIYTLKVTVNENNIKCYIDGMLKIDYTDTSSPYLSGAIGVGTFNAHAHFDDVYVMEVPELTSFSLGAGLETLFKYKLFSDTFSAQGGTASDYYPDNPWSPVRGTWSVVSGKMLQSDYLTNDYNVAFYDAGTTWTDYVLETTITPISGSGYQWAPYGFAGVIFRVSTPGIWGSGTFYYWLIGVTTDGSSGYSTLWHSPSRTALWGSALVGYAPAGNTLIQGQPNLVRVEVTGSDPIDIKLYLRDNLEASVTVSDPAKQIPTGAIGLATYTSSSSFDDVLVLGYLYQCNLHTKELGMPIGKYMITVWLSYKSIQVGSHPFELIEGGKAKGQQ